MLDARPLACHVAAQELPKAAQALNGLRAELWWDASRLCSLLALEQASVGFTCDDEKKGELRRPGVSVLMESL